MANVYKDKKKGTYYYVASLGFDDVTGKRIQKLKRGFRTRKEAIQAYNEIMNDYGKLAFKTNSSMSYKEYFESIFLPWYKGRVKERTYNNRLSSMKLHFQPFYRKKVSAITPISIQKWQNDLTGKVSNAYIRNIYGLFSMSLERAYKLGMISNNPAKTVGNVKKVRKNVEFWTKEEFEQILSTLDLTEYYEHFSFIVLWLFFMTGMRFGEGQALQWETDIDFEKQTLRIDKSMFYQNATEFFITEPKTPASKRVIALDETTINYLKEWQNVQQEMTGESIYILSYNGLPTNKHTIRHIIQRHSKLAEVHPIRIHGLRHSHASLLISMGENPLIIKDRLGHEDIKTTLGTYGHLYPNMNREVATKLTHVLQWEQNETVKEKKKAFQGNQYIKKEGI
ncbi:site-specific integrase [Carnobacterium divergens]|uniref:site-specific integrase n=1 Tax=Carnobacterium divergens TaxID=2748 RepID=UPI000D4391E3|nr:site-specific integrase [Carnobacterium divergens]MCO6016911.1 site-specific integrase [Carnobacterium divergens]TFI62550.1 site-specific integrase [Carnobacterium divergens]TFI89752.1 site-specific integrase [Carnobacterium divergens]TFJ04807.1 site-specific integrase [Carnobacterium divergens]TFJ06297.1 site-specific integrase [Carnobacterium divergens]